MARPKQEQKKEEVIETIALVNENVTEANTTTSDDLLVEGDKTPLTQNTDIIPTSGEPSQRNTPHTEKEVKLEKHIDEILKIYPQYSSLFIDNKGGVFTTDTNQNIRGNAILYKNPYHN